MAGLLDEKSWVGQAYDSISSGLLGFGNSMDEGIDSIAKELKIDQGGEAYAKGIVDASVQGLKNIGVPDSVFELEPATTKSNFAESSDRFIQNIPAHLPEVTKGIIGMMFNPIDTINTVANAGEGLIANLIEPTGLGKYVDKVDSLFGYSNDPNQAMVSGLTSDFMEKMSTEQGRREVFQEHPIDWLIGASVLRSGIQKIPPISPEMKASAKEILRSGADPQDMINAFTKKHLGSEMLPKFEMYSGRTSKTWNTEKYGSQADAKARATKIFDQEGVTKASIEKAFIETNHFMTPRGNVIHHINDKDMKFTDLATQEVARMPYDIPVDTVVGTYKASELFDHPELFKNYPELVDYKINIVTGKEVGSKTGQTEFKADGTPYFTTEGMHSRSKKEITIYVDPKVGLTARHSEVIIHEVQHAVQNADDLAGGGTVNRQTMLDLQQGLEAEKAMNQAKWMDKNTSKAEQAKLFERMQQIEAGLRSLELVVKDTSGMRPSNKAVMENMRESVYRALEGEWMARMTENEKQIYNHVEGLGQLDDLNSKIAEGKISPFSYMDNASKPNKFMVSLDRQGVDVDPLLKNMYEGGIISSPSKREMMDYMGYPTSYPTSVTEQSRRLLSDDQRYAGINKGILQQISKGYGRDRIEDDALKDALEKGLLTPNFKKEGTPIEVPEVSLRDYADRVLVSGMADTTNTGQRTMEVAGKEIGYGGVLDEGGQGFAFAPKNKGMAWANDQIAIPALMNNLLEAEELRKAKGLLDATVMANWQMGGGAINHSVQTTDTMVKAALTNLSKKDIADIDKMLSNQTFKKKYKNKKGKEDSKQVHLFPDWQGLAKTDLSKLTGPQRKDIIKHLDTQAKNEIGSMLQHQLANADPTQLFTDPYTLHNIMLPDASKGILHSDHRSYNRAVGGTGIGRIKEPVSLLDLMEVREDRGFGERITTERMADPNENRSALNKSIMQQKLKTVLTEESIDKAIKIGEAKLKQKKKKK